MKFVLNLLKFLKVNLKTKMGDERKVAILCGLLKSCNPTLVEVSKEMNLIENRDRMVWLTGK